MIGERVAAAIVTLRQNDGGDAKPTVQSTRRRTLRLGTESRQPPPPPVLGLPPTGNYAACARQCASQFRPDGPNALTSEEYTEDFNQVKKKSAQSDSATRTPEQTAQALFWTDHSPRVWNDGMLRLAAARELDLVQTARMLAIAACLGRRRDDRGLRSEVSLTCSGVRSRRFR